MVLPLLQDFIDAGLIKVFINVGFIISSFNLKNVSEITEQYEKALKLVLKSENILIISRILANLI